MRHGTVGMGRGADFAAKDAVKMLHVGIADLVGNGFDREVGVAQEAAGMTEARSAEIVGEGQAGILSEAAAEVG